MTSDRQDRQRLQRWIGRLRRAHALAALRLVAVRLLWLALALVAALFALDAMFALPAPMRLGLLAAFVGVLVVVAVATWWRAARARSLDRHVLRRIETAQPALGNDLINALEFSDRLRVDADAQPRDKSEDPTDDLMQSAVHLAVDELEPLRDWSALRPPSLRRESRLLMTLAILAVGGCLIFSHVFLAVLPRYANPFGDHPPYSPTHVRVIPAGTHIDYGGRLVVKAEASGLLPAEAQLIVEDASGRRVLDRIAMFQSEEGNFFQALENVRQPLRYHVAFPGGRSRRYDLTLNNNPRIESVQLALRHPAYTHLPEQVRMLSQPQLKGYAGSVARLTFSSNRPLSGGRVTIGDRSVKLVPVGYDTVAGEIELSAPGKIVATLTDVDGLESAEPWSGDVEILPDNKPAISIVSPGMDSFAIPSTKLPIVIEVDDDLGVGSVALMRNVNGSQDFRKFVHNGDGSDSFVHSVETLDLADLGARPGDIISYYAVATDSFPDAPHSAATPVFQLAVISFEEYRDFVRQQMTAEDLARKYQEYQARLDELAAEQAALARKIDELQKKAESGEALSAAEQQQLADAQRRQEELARQADALAEQMREEAAKPAIFDIEKSFKEDLAKFAGQLDEAAESMRAAGGAMENAAGAQSPTGAGQNLQQAAADQKAALESLGRTADQYREGIDAAGRELAQAMQLIGDVELFKHLFTRQQELERQVRFFRDKPEPDINDRVRMAELAEDQTDVQRQLATLADDLRAHAGEVRETLPKVADDADKIAAEIQSRNIPPLMGRAAEGLQLASGPTAHPPAAEALKQMEEMISYCNSSGEGGEGEMRLKIQMSGRGMKMGNSLAQIRAGMNPGVGRMGAAGRGSSGYYGSASQFGMFGTEQFGTPTQESRIAGAPAHAESKPSDERDPLASSFEELAAARDNERQVRVGGGEQIMEEYRPLIEAYFRGFAEDPMSERTP
jgi:hypothetical protein